MKRTKALILNPFKHWYFYLTPVIYYKQVFIFKLNKCLPLKIVTVVKYIIGNALEYFKSLENG